MKTDIKINDSFFHLILYLSLIVFLLSCQNDRNESRIATTYTNLGISQNACATDSIIQAIKISIPHREQAYHYLALIKKMAYSNIDAAFSYAKEAQQLANELDNKRLIAEVHYWLAMLKKMEQFHGHSLFEALADAKISSLIFEQLNKKFWLAKSYNLIGAIYESQDSLNKARNYQNQALSILTINHFDDSIHLALKGEIYHDLGNTYFNDDSTKAMRFFHLARELYLQTNNNISLARLNLVMGNTFLKEEKFTEAYQLFDQSLDYGYLHHDNDLLALVYEHLAFAKRKEFAAYRKLGECKEELLVSLIDYSNKMLVLLNRGKWRPYLELGIANHYFWLCNRDTSSVQEALVNYVAAFDAASKEGELEVMAYMASNIEKLCSSPGKPCFEYYLSEFPELQRANYTQFAIYDKEREQVAERELSNFRIALVKEEGVKRGKQIIWIGSIILLIIGLVSFIFIQLSEKRRLIARNEALRAQINPHFVSNTINAIEGLMNNDEKEKASDYLADFAHLSRGVLVGSRNSMHTLAQEVDVLHKYLGLLQLRFGEKFSYYIRGLDALNPIIIWLPSMIIQPFVENAFFRGIHPKKSKGHIDIYFYREKRHLIIEVDDDGIGRENSRQLTAKSILKRESFGMAITRERIEAIARSRKNSVKIIDKYDHLKNSLGTTVIIRIPYLEKS